MSIGLLPEAAQVLQDIDRRDADQEAMRVLTRSRTGDDDPDPLAASKRGPATPTGHLRDGGALKVATTASAVLKQRRIEASGGHVVGVIKFGDGRRTACAGCDFECTGRTNDEMAAAWHQHVRDVRPSRSGPVERVMPDEAD